MSALARWSARAKRAMPLALDRLMREHLASVGVPYSEEHAADVHGRMTYAMPPDAIADLATKIVIDAMSDDELVDWIADDLRQPFLEEFRSAWGKRQS